MKDTRFKYFFDNHYQLLCNYIMRLGADYDTSEDVAQEVLLKLWQQKGPFELAYALTCCKNKWIDWCRKTSSDKVRSEKWETLNHNHESQEELDAEFIKINKLNTLVRQLPHKTKEVFIMNKINGLTYSQIAERRNISVKTVENQISVALKFLRENW